MSSIAVDESALQILDIDECADEDQNDCDPNAKCSNIVGSYNCRCLKGYEGDGRDCTGKSLCCFIVFYMQLEKYSQTCIITALYIAVTLCITVTEQLPPNHPLYLLLS